jgi:hypothetical protein
LRHLSFSRKFTKTKVVELSLKRSKLGVSKVFL